MHMIMAFMSLFIMGVKSDISFGRKFLNTFTYKYISFDRNI